MPHQHAELPRGQPAAVEVDQVDPVEAGEVGLYLVAVLIEQGEEAA